MAAGCDGYYPWSAFIVAALSSPLHLTISRVMVKLRIDDPVDAVAVHFGSGKPSGISNYCLKGIWRI